MSYNYFVKKRSIVTQVITPHTIRVTVVNGMVTLAIIDGKWAELNQLQLPTIFLCNWFSHSSLIGFEPIKYLKLLIT